MKLFLPVLLSFSALLLLPHESLSQFRKNRKPQPSANFRIEQLAPRVWVAINNDNYGKAICNAGIVDLGSQTLIFDPFMNPAAAYELREAARRLTGRNPTIVVNSHHHTDHIRGNQAFLPNATIISTVATREQIEINEPGELEWEKAHAPTLLQALRKRMINATSGERRELPYWIGYYEGLVESSDNLFVAMPDQTFEDSLWIEGSKLSVKLVECRNGHTVSDAVLLIPALGIAFMGDLLYTERHPWLSDGSVQGWQDALRTFYEDTTYHTYLPGHGEVSSKPALKLLFDYLGDVQKLCEGVVTDSAQSALMSMPIPYPYNSWLCARFYQPNLQFLINAARLRSEGKLDSNAKKEESPHVIAEP